MKKKKETPQPQLPPLFSLERFMHYLDPRNLTHQRALAGLALIVMLGVSYYISSFVLTLPTGFVYTYGLAGVFVLYIVGTMTILIPVPIDPILIVIARIYPPELIALIAGIGASIGEMSAYLAGYLGHELIDGHEFTKAKEYFKKYGFFFIFTIAVLPAIPFDIVGLLGGYMKLPFFPFLGATMAGKVVKYYMIAKTGNWFFNGNQ